MRIELRQEAHYDDGRKRPLTIDLLSDTFNNDDVEAAKTVLDDELTEKHRADIKSGGYGGCVYLMIFNANTAHLNAVEGVIRYLREREMQKRNECDGINQRVKNTLREISQNDTGIKLGSELWK